jgi:hypothetical protein
MKPKKGEHRYDPILLEPDLDEARAGELVGRTARAMQSLRARGAGPDYYKLRPDPKAPVRYKYEDLKKWMAEQIRRVEPGETT